MPYPVGMVDLEVRELLYFRSVAEELNFSRAAERLGMAQPPLSRAIRQLERRLGVQLFERDNRRVRLTVAGATLLEESGRALDAMSAAARRTRRAGPATPTLVVTAKAGVATDLLRGIVGAFSRVPGAPRVEITVSGYGEQAPMVRDGRADLALVGSPFDWSGLDHEPLLTEPRVAALPADHELTRRAVLSCRDLTGLPMPRCPEASAPDHDYWAGRDLHPGPATTPVPGPVVHDSSQLLESVALGQAVALIPASLAERNARADVVYRPVPDASPYALAIAWRDGVCGEWMGRLVRTAVELTAGVAEAA